MANVKRSLQSVKTLSKLLDGRRARTPAGALLEMSGMANEKVLLTKELERGIRRRAEIEHRLAEIEAKTQRLMAYIQQDHGAIAAASMAQAEPGTPRPAATDEARPAMAAPGTAPAPCQFKTIELNY